MMRFRQIPPVGRAIIAVVAIGVFVIAGVACWTSYNAIYRLVGGLGLYGTKTNTVFPLLLDAAFLVAELAAILGGIMRTVTRSAEVSPGWPVVTMLLCGIGTIVFNVAHAYLIADDGLRFWRCVVSALPPVLMILSFQVLIAIVKWTMLHLGSPLRAGTLLGAPEMGTPQFQGLSNGQIGHMTGGGEEQKKAAILAVADQLGTAELNAIGPGGVATLLAVNHNITTSPNYVRKVLSESGHMAGRNGHGKP